MSSTFTNITFEELLKTMLDILLLNGVEFYKAEKVAETLANSTLDGVNSHGVNRLPLLIEYIRRGYVSINVEPVIINASNSFCQVDGKFGLGILNAQFCTNKAIEIASENGVGLVSIKNTNHWHRAGSYGWQAANKGFILICMDEYNSDCTAIRF